MSGRIQRSLPVSRLEVTDGSIRAAAGPADLIPATRNTWVEQSRAQW
ncbi:MAG: hypothetical protein ACRENP_04105 [Longimicrobiales bacterium]